MRFASSCDGRRTPQQTTRKCSGLLFFLLPFYDSCGLMRGRVDANVMQLRLSFRHQRDSGEQIHNKMLYLSHLGVESVWWCSQTVQVKVTGTCRFNYCCVSFLRAKIKKAPVIPSTSRFSCFKRRCSERTQRCWRRHEGILHLSLVVSLQAAGPFSEDSRRSWKLSALPFSQMFPKNSSSRTDVSQLLWRENVSLAADTCKNWNIEEWR